MKIVLDASMALSWIYERPDPVERDCSNKLLNILSEVECFVPTLFHIEIINALLIGLKRSIISEAQTLDFLNKLQRLPISIDEISVVNRCEIILALGREHELTAYDATYMELALRDNATLATFDNKLAKAMSTAGGLVYSG